MIVVVQALRKWQHFVQDNPTSIFTDNSSLQYFLPQRKIFPAKFSIEIIHKARKFNCMPDALSRMSQCQTISVVQAED